MIRFRPAFQVHPYVALTYDGRQMGVVVERDGSEGLVGLGLVRTQFSLAVRAPERLRSDHPIEPVQ